MERFLEVLKKTVNPASQVVGVNLLRAPEECAGLKIRLRDRRLTICQQIAYSRLYGWSTYCTAETSHCVLGAACAGLIAVPERVADGAVNAGVYQQDQLAAAKMQKMMPRVKPGMAGVLTYPVTRIPPGADPELLIVYLNTAQAMRMVQAFLYHKGGDFCMLSSGDAGVCSRGLAQVAITGEPAIEIPCLGDRRFAMAQDHELLVGIPAAWLERTADALEATHKAGIRYPVPFQLPDSCELPPAFITDENDC